MKIIKFKAWNIEEKRMYWNVQNAYDTLSCHNKEFPPDDDYCDKECDHNFYPCSFGEVLKDENYIVMQCTGLKDKNGKEVYEGDIIRLTIEGYDCENDKEIEQFEYVPVLWDNESCNFVVKWNGFEYGEMQIGYAPDYWDNEEGVTIKKFEVIGNIYENPELLDKINEK